MVTKHTLIALVEDKPGVLNKVASLFRRRGFNIESITVGKTETPGISRMTIVVGGTGGAVEQVRKHLDKLVDVIKVSDITGSRALGRELALIKVKATPQTRGEIIQIASIFKGDIIDVSEDSMIIEITGDEGKIDSFIELLKGHGIKEMVRTGKVVITRG